MDTSVFGVLKNLLNIHKTSEGAEKEKKETESVLQESSRVYQPILFFKSFFWRLIFALLEQLNICSKSLPRVSFRHVRCKVPQNS